ncbi:predicted protein [Uncinocarpus reesii 1704]|uniref:Rhodopsin n=1 Tax=Uncinocarpus reesii (strain UAMH 1704) TaxID=336963 RepID=C4JHH2_UNCRE|nr:uncharacterized protein UREG_01335 [Uncinocarpus reesii 1704]EEP76486.1 predicted protein [Uncinocarpus reesii 1704]
MSSQSYYQQPPPQGYPPQGYPPQGYPPQGYPPPVWSSLHFDTPALHQNDRAIT